MSILTSSPWPCASSSSTYGRLPIAAPTATLLPILRGVSPTRRFANLPQILRPSLWHTPPGSLVGVVMPPQKAQGEKDANQHRAGRAFFIGSESEHNPTEDGYIYLKLNVPPGSKSAGKIRVTISGNFQRVTG